MTPQVRAGGGRQHVGSDVLIVGVGNPVRGDDAVGPLVVDELRARHGDLVRTVVCDGDLSDLVLLWRPDSDVIVVDAMVSGTRPQGAILEIDALGNHLPTTGGLVSSHGVGLAEAVELARLLGRLPRSLTVIGVEARRFELFEPVSAEIASVVPGLAETLFQRLIDRDW